MTPENLGFPADRPESELSAHAFDCLFARPERGMEEELALLAATASLIVEAPSDVAQAVANGPSGNCLSDDCWSEELAASLWDDALLAG